MSEAVKVQQPTFDEVIRERHSVRAYDPEFKLTEGELRSLLEDAILAPSSSNLQPWRFLVIHDQALKEKLFPIANNQEQVKTSSAVIAVLADLEGFRNAELIYSRAVEKGYMPESIITSYVARISTYYSEDPARYRDTALIDAGLISMQLMLAAKARGLDTVPMGGFQADKFIEAFEVPANFHPVMLIAVGKAAGEPRKTERLSVDEVAYWNAFTGSSVK